MKLDRYYYITSLPPPGELGSKPPIEFAELRELLADIPDRQQLVDCLFLLDDLIQREAYLAGELNEVTPCVLNERQLRNESPLPEFLLPTSSQTDRESSRAADSVAQQPESAGETQRKCPADQLWEAYFRHALQIAKQFQCGFLRDWARHELTLRNAMVSVRAKRLGLDEADYLVAVELAETDEHMPALISDWENAPTPLAGHQAMIRARWDWVAEHDHYFTFHNDELAAYALRLMLLGQWRRITGDP